MESGLDLENEKLKDTEYKNAEMTLIIQRHNFHYKVSLVCHFWQLFAFLLRDALMSAQQM